MQEVICHYCGKSLNAANRLFIHIKIQPQKGGWGTETCQKLIPEDTPMAKWAKLILRMTGNIPEIKLRGEYAHQKEKGNDSYKSIGQTKRKQKRKEKEEDQGRIARKEGDQQRGKDRQKRTTKRRKRT